VVSRLTAIKDAVGRQTSFTYDALNRLLTQTDAKTGVTQLSYDPNGNLLSLTDAKGNATTYTYDGMNRPVTLTNSLGESASAAYDVNGNLIGFTDRRKQNSSYTYDTLNRLVTETCEDSTVAISYDANGHPVQVNDSASGDFTFTYDAAGRLTGTATPYGAVEYTRDGLGRASSRQVAGQPPVAYTYDKAGNLLNASTPTASVTRSYDPRNLLSTASRMNHVSSQYNYDQLGRLTSLTHTGPGGVLISQTYSYDAAGNRTNATNSTAQSLITQAVTPTSYNADNEQLQFGSTSNTFDANGNLTASTAAAANTVYTWDSRHRLTSLSAPNGQVTTFTYDFAGNLLQQRDVGPTANVTQTFVLDDLTNIAYVNRSDGDQYSVLAGQWIDDHMATMHTSGLTEYGLGDALDSTHATVDQTGAAKGQFYYDPFGQTIAANSTYPFQYTGRTPVSNGLYYYRARYYSPAMGRFISEDVNPRTQLANLYVYALNSPAELTDPSGRQSIAVVPTIFTLYTLCLANMPLCTAMAQSCFNGAAGVTSPPQKIYNIAAMPVGWLCRSVSESIQNGLAYLRRPRPKSPRIPPCPDGFEIQISGGTTARGYPPLP
jgi:RHS repeat-associated protein